MAASKGRTTGVIRHPNKGGPGKQMIAASGGGRQALLAYRAVESKEQRATMRAKAATTEGGLTAVVRGTYTPASTSAKTGGGGGGKRRGGRAANAGGTATSATTAATGRGRGNTSSAMGGRGAGRAANPPDVAKRQGAAHRKKLLGY